MRLLSLALAFALLTAWPAAAKTPLPTFEPGSDYNLVRAELLKRGLTAVHVPNQDQDDCFDHREISMCARYPEVWACEQVSGMPCAYVWRSPEGNLLILNAGYSMKSELALYDPLRDATADEQKLMFEPQHSPFPKFKRHLPYGQVRKRLIALGFRPVAVVDMNSFDCEVFKSWCRQFRELESCSGTGAGFCNFIWLSPKGRFVKVETIEPIGFYTIWYASSYDVSEIRKEAARRHRTSISSHGPAGMPDR